MASLGQELKKERKARQISLEEIANTTKISLQFLKALENDQLDALPGKFFVKGIIRAYARCIGIDEYNAVNKYEESLQKEQILKKEKKKEKIKLTPLEKIKANLFNLVFISILLLLIFLSIYFISQPQSPLPVENKQAQIPLEEQKPIIPPIVEPEPEETRELYLEIQFLQETWIQVFADGKLTSIDGVKMPGDKVNIRAAEELVLHLGNAGGISYFLNGKKGKALGSVGDVVKNIKITPDNYKQFLVEEEENPSA